MSLVIRPMRAEELDACAELYDRVVCDTFTWIDLSASDQRAKFREEAGEEAVYVAEDAGRILGIAALYLPDSFLHSLYIDLGIQSRGVGLALLKHIDDVAPEPILLKVQVLNFNARRFYAREGFWVAEDGGESPPSNDRWLLLTRDASRGVSSPTPRLDIAEAFRGAELDLCAELYERVAARRAAWEPAWARTAASKRASFDGETVLVAREHGVLAGFAAYTGEDGLLHSLFVEPQGAGIGPALMRAVGQRLGRPFELECDERNVAGLRFYERNGFVRTGAEPHETFRMIRMRSDDRWG